MKVLGIDSSTDILAIGLADTGEVIGELTVRSQREHASRIIETIDKLLVSHGAMKNDLTGIAVAIGPGSFTGLRVGLAVAKGMALALEIPLVGVSTYEVLSERLRPKYKKFCLIAPVRRGEFYFLRSDTNLALDEAVRLVPSTKLAETVGELPWAVIGHIKEQPQLPSANLISSELAEVSGGRLALYGARLIAAGRSDDVGGLEPLYIAPSQAERKFGNQ